MDSRGGRARERERREKRGEGREMEEMGGGMWVESGEGRDQKRQRRVHGQRYKVDDLRLEASQSEN
jgi:hypothetical protein